MSNEAATVAVLARYAVPLLLFAALWWLLSGGEVNTWIVGLPAVIGAAYLFVRSGVPLKGVRLRALLRFLLLFFRLSFMGGIDVARRVLRPRLAIEPAVVVHNFERLPEGGGRLLFIAAVGLCPGTLCFDRRNDAVVVHLLDQHGAYADELARIEAAIAALWEPR